MTADSVDGTIQQVLSSGGQQVITIVTDSIQLANLQAAGSIGQPIIVTMPDGQQGETTARCFARMYHLQGTLVKMSDFFAARAQPSWNKLGCDVTMLVCLSCLNYTYY